MVNRQEPPPGRPEKWNIPTLSALLLTLKPVAWLSAMMVALGRGTSFSVRTMPVTWLRGSWACVDSRRMKQQSSSCQCLLVIMQSFSFDHENPCRYFYSEDYRRIFR